MPRPKPFIEEEAGKLITAENNNQKQVRTIEGILFHKHGGGLTDEFPNHDDFDNYDAYLAEVAKVGPKVSGDGIEDKTITMEKLHKDLQDTIKAGAVEKDEIKSKMIDDADGTTKQDTAEGSGIKTPHIQDNAVTTKKIADDAVTMNKLDEGVKTAISAGAVGVDEIKSAMIDNADGTTGQNTEGGSGIKTPHIQENAVATGKIANEAVTMDKLHADVKTAISAGDVGVDEIKSAMIADADGENEQDTTKGLGIKTPHIQDNAVATGKIANEAVTEEKIADEAVTMDKLNPEVKNAISAAEAGDEVVTTGKIANGAVTPEKLDRSYAQSPIKTNDIDDEAVTNEKLREEAVTKEKIARDAVRTHHIADDAVTQAKVTQDAISIKELKTTMDVIEGEISINAKQTASVYLGSGGTHAFYLPSVKCDLIPGYISWKRGYSRKKLGIIGPSISTITAPTIGVTPSPTVNPAPLSPVDTSPISRTVELHELIIENLTDDKTITAYYKVYKLDES